MSVNAEIQVLCDGDSIPDADLFQRWVEAAVGNQRQQAEVTIRVVDAEESRQLNQHYRDRDSATNVLAFPLDVPDFVDETSLGDLVICRPVVEREAREQGKPVQAHWAHMVVHGTLHLLGHDHQDPDQASAMEALEVQILGSLGYPDPYWTGDLTVPPVVRTEDGAP
ncbi:MAG: rRNA maturation RNase YbeY [Gammaproteobacteria bacterium]